MQDKKGYPVRPSLHSAAGTVGIVSGILLIIALGYAALEGLKLLSAN